MIAVGYLQLEGVIAAMGGSVDRGLIRRRFKYLQRMSFPRDTNTGRGRRTVLDLDQVLQVIVAMELMQVGASPTRAVRVLRTNWAQLRPAIGLGWLACRKPQFAILREMLVMNAGAFEDAGKSEDPHEPVAHPLRSLPALDLITGLGLLGSTTRVVLDPARLVAHLLDHANGSDAPFQAQDLDTAFVRLWTSSREDTPDEWMSDVIQGNRLDAVESAVQESLSALR